MLTTTKLTNAENISLSQEIAVVGAIDTPLTTLLLQKGNVEEATAKIHTWRERRLDTTDDVSVAEGSDLANIVNSQRAELNNVCEILMKGVVVSGSALATAGTSELSDLFASEIQDRLFELKVNLEKQIINGIKDDGSVSGIRKMAGILEFVDDANKITSNVVDETTIKALVRKLWEQGTNGAELYALVNADIKEQIDEIYKDRYSYQHVNNDFGLVVSSINTNYGTLNLLLDRHMPADKVVAFNVDAISIAHLREPQFEIIGKTGDATRGMVLLESTLKVATPKAVSLLTVSAS